MSATPTTTTTTSTTSTTAASVYQELRAHLSELKLADAAAALPGVLDQAAAEGWTITAALEHLRRALDLDDRAGVKQDIARIEKASNAAGTNAGRK